MNNHSFDDPQLQSLEARLAARPPQVSSYQRDELLYACAFAAGHAGAARSLRNWRSATAVLCVLLVGVTIPHLYGPDGPGPSQMASRAVERPVHAERTSPKWPFTAEPAAVPKSTAANLDAWQVPKPGSEPLSEQLAQLEQSDPHLRSLTMGRLRLALLKP